MELDAEAARLAEARADRVLVGDAEELDLEAELGGERFDAILFADVLEHLRDPAALLKRVRPLVDEGGVVIASIPNIAHAAVRLALLGGSFRYREQGLLDESHLRFFTREGVQDLFEGSGYLITQWLRRRLEIEETEIPVPSSVPEEARAWATSDPEATTYQFVVCAVPSEPAAQLYAWRTKLGEARAELEQLRPLAAEAEVLRAELEELQAAPRRGRRAAPAAAGARGPAAPARRRAGRVRRRDRSRRGGRLRLALLARDGADARRDPAPAQAQAVSELSLPQVEEPLVSVVMVLYGGWKLGVRAISALAANTDPVFELILVDNASPDDSLAQIERQVEGATIVRNEQNARLRRRLEPGRAGSPAAACSAC